ncbi:MAG TPA: AmmeMemoRadiSam system protein A, partial [Syntrophorhabdaceae bacterium]|nr:AmmeMemoRadiSam system protein A [Syntrophorhabdaceae bacterium]
PAVVASMMAATKMGAEAEVLHYTNSGDTAGDRTRVVGYGSLAFWQPDGKAASSPLAAAERKRLLAIARKTLEEYVSSKTVPEIDVKDPRLLERRGVFVTLTIHGQLRGCIGYIKPVAPLYRSVVDMTVAASSRDMRFRPVTKGELKDIEIEISVMSPLKLITSVDEIKVGIHGLYIVKGGNAGLLLPQVATQYKWGREEFLQNTCRKAGLPENSWKDKETKVYVFSAQIFSE